MGLYKEFIEVTATTGERVLIKVVCIESIEEKPDKTIINLVGDTSQVNNLYYVVETFEEVKRLLED